MCFIWPEFVIIYSYNDKQLSHQFSIRITMMLSLSVLHFFGQCTWGQMWPMFADNRVTGNDKCEIVPPEREVTCSIVIILMYYVMKLDNLEYGISQATVGTQQLNIRARPATTHQYAVSIKSFH